MSKPNVGLIRNLPQLWCGGIFQEQVWDLKDAVVASKATHLIFLIS